MLDVLSAAQLRLFDSEEPQDVAIATIIATEGSVPRPVGTSMLVEAAGSIEGSLTTGDALVLRFGYSDNDAFAVGLMCGGSIEVLINPFRAGSSGLRQTADGSGPRAAVMRLPSAEGGDSAGGSAPGAGGTSAIFASIADEDSDNRPHPLFDGLAQLVPQPVLGTAVQRVATLIRSGRTGRVRIALPAAGPSGGGYEPIELFVETQTRPAHLVVIGANAFGQALVEAARPLGHRITVCDPRPAFTDPSSFPGAEVVRVWPHRFLTEAAETHRSVSTSRR